MISAPGVYPGRPMAEYLAAPALSASLLQTAIEECPRAAWFKSWLNPKAPARDSNGAQDSGTIAHGILLEGSTANVEVIDPNLYPTKTTGNIPDGWTNKDIRAARDAAIAAGKTPVLVPQMVVIRAMVEAAWAFIESIRETEPEIYKLFQPNGGDSELTVLWDEDGTLCRMRPDRINAARTLVADYKTTLRSAEPAAWGRTQMVGMGYYTSAAFYRRGAEAAFGTRPEYVYLVQEQEAPHLCALVGLDPAAWELGGRKIARGLEVWRECQRRGYWPGYPTRVCYPEIPPWEAARWEAGAGYGEERQAEEGVDELGKPLPRGTREAWAAFGHGGH
jgi:hypothetical protein